MEGTFSSRAHNSITTTVHDRLRIQREIELNMGDGKGKKKGVGNDKYILEEPRNRTNTIGNLYLALSLLRGQD